MFHDPSFGPASRVTRAVAGGILACGLLAGLNCGITPAPAAGDTTGIPNFAADPNVSWSLEGRLDDLLPPASGPGPVSFDPAHPFHPGTDYRVADLNSPILQPWTKVQMKKANDEVLAGKVPFRARERCWPVGVPGFDAYSWVEPFYFYERANEIVVINQGGPEIRHIYMNVPHSKHVKPSWYGESVGHYEGGDTLVIDTIGLNDRTFVDNYRTPHTTNIHVIERWKIAPDLKTVDVSIYVEDPGAFTSSWRAVQRWSRVEEAPILQVPCNENNDDHFTQGLVPIAHAETQDF